MQNRRTKQKQKQKAYRQKHINHKENQSYAHINHPDFKSLYSSNESDNEIC